MLSVSLGEHRFLSYVGFGCVISILWRACSAQVSCGYNSNNTQMSLSLTRFELKPITAVPNMQNHLWVKYVKNYRLQSHDLGESQYKDATLPVKTFPL